MKRNGKQTRHIAHIMPRKPKNTVAQPGLLEAHVATAPCVPAIREALKQWRDDKYKGVTETTRILLNYWFNTDHRLPNGRKFEYHYFQREAIETLIYLYEVAGVRRHKALLEKYATNINLRLLQYDEFARYCVKMATGSGKTKVMALAMTWQYLNAAAESREDYAKTFLLIAPNVIVYERLKTDFSGGRIFRADPAHPARTANLLGYAMLHARRRRTRQFHRGSISDQHPAAL